MQGAENDIELNENGKQQSLQVGRYLKLYRLDKPFDLIIASPLKRAHETAKIIANQIGYDINKILLSDDILETKSGLLATGKTEREMRKTKFYNDFYNEINFYHSLDKIKRIELDEMFPSTKTCIKYKIEMLEDFKKRLRNFINFLVENKSKKILIVSHNGTITWLNKLLSSTHYGLKGDLANGKNCHLTYYKYVNNTWSLITPPTTYFLTDKI